MEPTLTVVNVWSYRVKGNGSVTPVLQSSQWFPVSVVPGTMLPLDTLETEYDPAHAVAVGVGVGAMVAVAVAVAVAVGVGVFVAVGVGVSVAVAVAVAAGVGGGVRVGVGVGVGMHLPEAPAA